MTPRLTTQPAQYRTRIRIEQPVRSVGETHDPQVAWRTFAERWAQVETSSGREFTRASQVLPELSAIVRMRWDEVTSRVTSDFRLRCGSRTWNIASAVNDGERNRELVLWCTEVIQS